MNEAAPSYDVPAICRCINETESRFTQENAKAEASNSMCRKVQNASANLYTRDGVRNLNDPSPEQRNEVRRFLVKSPSVGGGDKPLICEYPRFDMHFNKPGMPNCSS